MLHLKKQTLSVGDADHPDTKYPYYPLQVEGVTLKDSLSPACVSQNKKQTSQ